MGLDIGLRGSEVFACLIGANGAGKSTTLMTIFGVERAAQGEIQFNAGHRSCFDVKIEIVAAG
jgi:branched-chain amino acid transport system ATP-binding protein